MTIEPGRLSVKIVEGPNGFDPICKRKRYNAVYNVAVILWFGGLLVGAYLLGERRFYDLASVRGWLGLAAALLGILGMLMSVHGPWSIGFLRERECHCVDCIRRMNEELAGPKKRPTPGLGGCLLLLLLLFLFVFLPIIILVYPAGGGP